MKTNGRAAGATLLVLAIGWGCETKETGPEAPDFRVSGKYVRGPAAQRVIIFVNGIFGDELSTWRNEQTGKYWPSMLASDPQFAATDIYVHTFQSPKLSTAQNILQLAQRMGDHLETDQVMSSHKELVFLCHSMGGLITRALLLNLRLPSEKVPFVYFFGTPTTGANVAGIAANISKNPQLGDMRPLDGSGYLQTLREAWLNTADDPNLDYPSKIASPCAYELRDTWGFRVVEETSATHLCNRPTRAILANHLDIVKPADEKADPYLFFKAAYLRRFGATAEPVRRALDAQRSRPMIAFFGQETIVESPSETLFLKRVKGTREYIEVGCDEEKQGVVEASVDLGPREEVTEVHPAIVNTDNIKLSSVALVRYDRNTATVQYKVRGLDRVFLNCPGGGHADVVVNFVVSRSRSRDDHRELPDRPSVGDLLNQPRS